MRPDRDRPWTAAELEQVRTLWAEGLTAGQIGERLQRTRNSVLGKVHRLNLPPRPSPLGPRGDGTPQRPKVPRPPRPAPLPPGTRTLPPVEHAAPAPSPPPPPPAAPLPRRGTCQWPIGEPRTAGFRFCGDPLWHGTRLPYCETHARYARPKPRNESAA